MILLALFLNSSFFCLSSCGEAKKSKTELIFEGQHELRKFNVKTEEGTRWSASYFLIGGGGSGYSYTDTKVTFAWKMNTGEYALSELRMAKIRVKIDSTIQNPYITFRWSATRHERTLEHLMSSNVNYIVVHCKEEDFPSDVNISELN